VKGFVIVHVQHGLFLGDSPAGAAWSRCAPPPEADAAPVFPTAEEALNYARVIKVEGLLFIQEAQADRIAPWGVWYASMGTLVQCGFDPWLQPDSPCIGPLQ
jgi:hypothetical protein